LPDGGNITINASTDGIAKGELLCQIDSNTSQKFFNKPELASVEADSAEFNRDSGAYLSDGTLVAANQPRYEGAGVRVEPGTTNLIPLNRQKFVGWAWGTYEGSEATLTQDVVVPEWGAIDATRIQTSGGSSVLKYYHANIEIPPAGAMRSEQVWVKNIGDKAVVVHSNCGRFSEVQPGESRLVKFENIIGVGNSTLQMQFRALDAADSLDFIAWRPMVEAKPYCTSWTDGTRAPETLSVPGLPTVEGEIEFTVEVTPQSKRQVAGETPRLLTMMNAPSDYYGLVLHHAPDGATFGLQTRGDDGQVTSKWFSDYLIPNGLRHLRIKITLAAVILYCGDTEIARIDNPALPSAWGRIWLGSSSTGTNHADASFGDLKQRTLGGKLLGYWPLQSDLLKYIEPPYMIVSANSTSQELIKIDNVLVEPKDYYFERASNAMYPSDSQSPFRKVEGNVERFIATPEGLGILIEPGTTNLIPLKWQKFAGWIAYRGAEVTLTQGIAVPEWGATDATRIQTSGGTNVLKYVYTVGTPPAGALRAQQIYIKNTGTTTVRIYSTVGSKWASILPGESKLVKMENIIGNGTGYLHIQFQAPDVADSLDFIAWRPMAEAKPYCTSWTDGTRAPETLSVPGLPTVEGEIEFTAEITDKCKRQVVDEYPMLVYIARADGNRGLTISHAPTTATYQLRTDDDAGASTSLNFSDSRIPNGTRHLRIKITLAAVILYCDDREIARIINPKLPSGWGRIYLGSSATGTNHADAIFLSLDKFTPENELISHTIFTI
jgi:hypothetical protein